jgi:hypothetical protein
MYEDSKWVGTEVLQVDQLESVKSQRNVRNVSCSLVVLLVLCRVRSRIS